MIQLALVVLSFLPHKECIDQVDIAELNHVICPTNGNEQGVYWVWWSWQVVDGIEDYRVRAWLRASQCGPPVNGVQEFWDEKNKVRRRIESKVYVETFTFYDRESEDRKILPESRRKKLRQPQ